jgi:predicted transcriptional regulator of viral defense system
MLQVPSYVSFMTALWVYGITTQVPRSFFESASLKRSRKFDIKGVVFNYYKLKKELYFEFTRRDNIFIATKEKAFLDTIYLYSFGKYKADLSSLDAGKLDKNKLRLLLKAFPRKTRLIAEKLCKT